MRAILQLEQGKRKNPLPNVTTVSYTHLLPEKMTDVEEYARRHRRFSFRDLLGKQASKFQVVVTFLAILEPVSYTHLDVYKRQVWMYRSRAVMQVKEDMEDTFPKCREICMKFCRSRNIFVRMAQSILRLFAPML